MSELKILLVDDETIIREGLRSFPWQELGCRVAGEAEDGEEALMLAKVLQPDIILTDIRMPEMDGLEFAAKAKEALPGAEIILLTGFDSFDYAQAAIRTGVYDYLLKPVSLDDIRETVGKLCEHIRARSSRDARYEMLQKKYEQSLPMLIGRLTSDLLHGRLYGREDLRRKLALFDVRIEKYLVLTARVKNLPGLLRERKIEPWLLEFGICNICEEILERYCRRVLMDCDSSEYRFILCFPAGSREEDCLSIASQACGKVQKAVRDYIGESIRFGLSDIGDDPYRMNRHYRQAVDACREGGLLGEDGVLQFRDVQTAPNDAWLLPEGERAQLLEAVASGDTDGIRRFFEGLAADLPDTARADSVRILLIELLVACARASGAADAVGKWTAGEGIGALAACDEAGEALEKARELLLHMARQNGQTHRDYHEMTVQKIIRYLREHYREDLSLDGIAAEFRLSGSYIGRLLKKHTGHSFLDSLVGIRMEQAARLLESPDITVAAVAEQTGYRDQSYFIQVFKKYKGMTPKEYQNFTQMTGSSY